MTSPSAEPPTVDSPVYAAFVAAWRARASGPTDDPVADADVEIASLVLCVVGAGCDAWPELSVSPTAFAEHVARHLPAGRPLVDGLLAVRTADLALAHACARGQAAALAAFEEIFADELTHVLSRVRAVQGDLEDAKQICRQKLFAASPPKIGDYAGQGDLRHWLRVTLLRTAIDLSRRKGGAEELRESSSFDAVAAGAPDPELDYLKRLYANEFREAFEAAATALETEDRNLLRQHYTHELTVDQIGALYGIHRATAARRVARAREALFAGTRRRLMERLRLDRRELDSVMRLLESGVSVSVRRVLGASAAEHG